MSDIEHRVLALKYRPKNFKELIGQDIMVETVTNSIKLNKLPNAYLLTGIRGVGKTTTARLIAMSLNCENRSLKTCEPCGLCDSCVSVREDRSLDVIEMDAASKTGVDDIREIIDNVKYKPAISKYKIFIIDEVHMLSKQAFNALLKTLEEPPAYLKFIFATTEIKKIPITVVSRCQRFDLSRIKSTELFEFIKKIKDKENGKVSDEALKLIVKISEGSVRDALSLLDRGLLSLEQNTELDLNAAQKIFGYFDKSQLINLFELVLKGDEEKVINIYRKIYDQGVEPKVFINDFLEILYYFKNINSLSLESTNFSLNDEEFSKIKEISNQVNSEILILFWQFAVSSLEELDIVSNQHLSIEMFLIRLMHLSSIKLKQDTKKEQTSYNIDDRIQKKEKEDEFEDNSRVINQIKNVAQEEKHKPDVKQEVEAIDKNLINSFEDLLDICTQKKEIKLKYELEKNVNLVKFERNRIEISFNDNLDKDFVKDLSSKLFEWTSERWIITFSKSKGEMSVKEKQKNKKDELINEAKSSEAYKIVMKKFPDAELVDVKYNGKEEDKND